MRLKLLFHAWTHGAALSKFPDSVYRQGHRWQGDAWRCAL